MFKIVDKVYQTNKVVHQEPLQWIPSDNSPGTKIFTQSSAAVRIATKSGYNFSI